ncbi:MAG TPA: tetratricopeptide repeat protein [Candidatus Acidoferrales bacterium]|nr:tetratricopeptide repeat protein [Candidatus Acidoferrales bacterium]
MIRFPYGVPALFVLLVALPARASVPPLLVPPHRDSVTVSSPEAPLLAPGRTTLADTTHKSRAQLALEQRTLGHALERQGAPVAAIAAYRIAVQLDPTIPLAHYRMGRLFSAVGQHAAALKEYAAETLHHPDDRDARRWLGLELAQTGDTARANALLESMVRRDPKDGASWRALGFAYSTAGRASQGEAALRQAIQLDANDAEAWRDLGVVLGAGRRDDEARKAYERAVQLDPADAGSYVNLGNLERRNQRYPAALAAYHAAEQRDSTLALGWRGEVEVLKQMQRGAEAGEVFRRWLATQPDNLSLRDEAMDHFIAIGRPDVALELGRDGVRRLPRSGETHLALGMAYRADHELRAALAELRRSEALFSHPEQRARVATAIGALRAEAPDSLRAFFAADSVAHEGPAPADTAAARLRR